MNSLNFYQWLGWPGLTTPQQRNPHPDNQTVTTPLEVTPKPMHQRVASILFTDIAGFSVQMATHPQLEVVTDLDRYFGRVSRCVGAAQGRVDKLIGDGLLAVFDTPEAAVSAALAIQQAVAYFNVRQLARRRSVFPTRIAVDTGPVVEAQLRACPTQQPTVFGGAVNYAAHLLKQTGPGRILISQRTRAELPDHLSVGQERLVIVDAEASLNAVYEM